MNFYCFLHKFRFFFFTYNYRHSIAENYEISWYWQSYKFKFVLSVAFILLKLFFSPYFCTYFQFCSFVKAIAYIVYLEVMRSINIWRFVGQGVGGVESVRVSFHHRNNGSVVFDNWGEWHHWSNVGYWNDGVGSVRFNHWRWVLDEGWWVRVRWWVVDVDDWSGWGSRGDSQDQS